MREICTARVGRSTAHGAPGRRSTQSGNARAAPVGRSAARLDDETAAAAIARLVAAAETIGFDLEQADPNASAR